MNAHEFQARGALRLNPAVLHPPARGNGNGELAKETLARLRPSQRNLSDFLSCSRTSISGLISRDAICVAPDLSVEGLTTLLLERGLSAVAVIDADRKLLGIVSTAHLLGEVQDRGDVEERVPLRVPGQQGLQMELGDGFHATYLARATVEEIMTPFPFALLETTSIAQAATLMASEGVTHLPVVGPGNRVVGTLTALDVMRWIAHRVAL